MAVAAVPLVADVVSGGAAVSADAVPVVPSEAEGAVSAALVVPQAQGDRVLPVLSEAHAPLLGRAVVPSAEGEAAVSVPQEFLALPR